MKWQEGRKPPPIRAARMHELRQENGRIVNRYVEAIEDAGKDNRHPAQKKINERMGL